MPDNAILKKAHNFVIKLFGILVTLNSIQYCTYICVLSTKSSTWTLKEILSWEELGA